MEKTLALVFRTVNLYDKFDVPYYASKALQLTDYFLPEEPLTCNQQALIHYDKAGNYLPAYTGDQGEFPPSKLKSGQPFAVDSGRVGAISDFTENVKTSGEGLQWCAYCEKTV